MMMVQSAEHVGQQAERRSPAQLGRAARRSLVATFVSIAALGLPLHAEEPGAVVTSQSASSAWTLSSSDRIFLISAQADTMAPMSFRVGTVDQLQTVQAGANNGWGSGQGFSGYYADFFADFAPLSWLQLGLTMNYGTVGDPATLNIAAQPHMQKPSSCARTAPA
jgi:hypothetical protein